jgi:hypothetical protein
MFASQSSAVIHVTRSPLSKPIIIKHNSSKNVPGTFNFPVRCDDATHIGLLNSNPSKSFTFGTMRLSPFLQVDTSRYQGTKILATFPCQKPSYCPENTQNILRDNRGQTQLLVTFRLYKIDVRPNPVRPGICCVIYRGELRKNNFTYYLF